MSNRTRWGATLALIGALLPATAHAAGLAGSRLSMARQHEIAIESRYAFLKTPAQVQASVAAERLVPVGESADLALSGVAYPYARPEVRAFVERLAADYRAAHGARLVVTSLTRPTSRQPGNASPLSVHPAGMAVDLRIPADASQREWLESTLLRLEREEVLDVTRERRPPHYHIAVFPRSASAWVAARDSADLVARADSARRAQELAAREAAARAAAAARVEPGSASPASRETAPAFALFGLLALGGGAGAAMARRARKTRDQTGGRG